MLTIKVGIGTEAVDEATNKFVNSEYFTLEFEHSLVSLSKWESKFKKPFLSKGEKSEEETLFYFKECMLLTKNPPEEIFQKLSKSNVTEIQNYINTRHSATFFNDSNERPMGGSHNKIITSAVIHGWLVGLRIPFETRHWHLNDLFDLVRVVNDQTKTPKKMSRSDAARQQAALNEKRRREMGTRG